MQIAALTLSISTIAAFPSMASVTEFGLGTIGIITQRLDERLDDTWIMTECISYEVITAPDDFSAVREALEAQNIPMMEADVTMILQTWVELTAEDDIKKLNRILDLLDEDDDVQAVYHNWDE